MEQRASEILRGGLPVTEGVGCRVQGLGCRVLGLGFRINVDDEACNLNAHHSESLVVLTSLPCNINETLT
jgi:hypothetical protein